MADILVVDDDAEMLESVRQVLEEGRHRVTTTTDSLHAIDLIEDARPDLLLLDVVMPEMTGIEICRRVRSDPFFSRLPILFLTGKGRPSDIVQGLEAGGDDYLLKPFNALELLARITALLRRMPGGALDAHSETLTVGSLTLSLTYPEAAVGETVILLTPIEHRLLYCLMSHAGQVQPVEQLLREVWGYTAHTGDPQLVRVHVAHLRSKLALSPDSPWYIHNLHGRGYLIENNVK